MPESTDTSAHLTPSVTYLVSALGDRIRSGHYAQGSWLPSERALAEEFAVCRPIVRQAIGELESRNLIQRRAGHRPVVWNGQAQEGPTARQQRRSIGLWITGDPGDAGPTALTRGVFDALTADAFRLVVACPQRTSSEEALQSEAAGLRRMAEDEDVAGVILWYLGGEANIPALEAIRAANKPLVFVDRQPPAGFEADFVGVDNERAAADAVRHLISLGHRTIAHITNPDQASTVRERQAGYQRALREAGIPFQKDLILSSEFMQEGSGSSSSDSTKNYWDRLVDRMRELPVMPTAVFALNDVSAFRLTRALRAADVRVPEDVAVVGFDDSERWSYTVPFMTSVSQPFEQIGSEAVHLLLHRLESVGGTGSTYRHVLLPAPLKARTSSDPHHAATGGPTRTAAAGPVSKISPV